MGTELFLPPTHAAHIGYLVRLSVSLDFLSVRSRKTLGDTLAKEGEGYRTAPPSSHPAALP
jgi:hypothetical protein